MTLNERLFACGLRDAFNSALRRGDRAALAAVLIEMAFTADEASDWIAEHFERLRPHSETDVH